MGKPAARIGDTTAHGGSIVAGAPTVLIGGVPAARMSDMHVCPMLNPGVPPPPHVGGTLMLGSPTVLICGQMAARMGDIVMCSGPPDSVMMGCPTVLIGESPSGAGGGGGPAGAAASAAVAGGGVNPNQQGDHFLDVKFVDKAGLPVKGVNYKLKAPGGDESRGTLKGEIKLTGIKQGNYEIELKEIVSAQWSKRTARDCETVKMSAQTVGFDPGSKATFEIWEKNYNKADRPITTMPDVALNNGKSETTWQYTWAEEELSGDKEYSAPQFYFAVKIDGYTKRSGLLGYKDFVELVLSDGNRKPVASASYRVFLSNGEVREGKLDSNGYKKVDKVPPGKWSAEFPDHPYLTMERE